MNKFEVREFYGEEALRYKKICTKQFRYPNSDLADEELYKKKLTEQDNARDKDFIRLGAFLDGVLYAAIEIIPFDVYIDRQECRMYGIGGVVSDPECPEKGAVKLIYKRAFELMREKGVYISHLYPFEANYYRQYGYEVSCEYAVWKIPLTAIIPYKTGCCRAFDNSEAMKKDIISIYNKFASEHNMAIKRTEKQWENFFAENNAYTSGVFSYIHYTNGEADAYMSYKTAEKADRPMDLEADRFWFTSYDGLRGLLSYFLLQKSYAENVIIKLPSDISLSAIIDPCGGWGKKNASKTVFDNGTSKVIDVGEFLKQVKYIGEGSASIKITDEYCPWNNACFKVEFGDKIIVSRGEKPDIEMGIRAFTSAVLGRYSFEECRIFPDVKVHGNEENLKKIFYKKNCWIEEHF